VDAYGRPQRIKAHDYLARIFQHEIDHLEGVMFIDKADPATIRKLTAEEAENAMGEAAEAAALMG
jgi:peptide deformylase